MADDLDIDAMLEDAYRKKGATTSPSDTRGESTRENGRDSGKDRSRKSSDKDRERDRDREHRRHKRSRSRDRERKKRSRSRDRKRNHRSRSPRERRRRSRTPPRRRSRSPRHRYGAGGGAWTTADYKIDPKTGVMSLYGRAPTQNLTPEERDQRTVFCMQLSQRVRPRDLEEFFSAVGTVVDVKLITDTKTRRSKGIAYVEFAEVESAQLALGLSGQKLMGVPILVQQTQAEKNRMAAQSSANAANKSSNGKGPIKVYVGSLHFNITESMLKGIFEPFGKIEQIQLIIDTETQRSKGYGFVTFHEADDGKRAIEQLNGFELAGRPMKVAPSTDRQGEGIMKSPGGSDSGMGGTQLDNDELDRRGIDLGATGRLALMAKLAQGTGMELPSAAAAALNRSLMGGAAAATAPPIATQCFMLSNMFNPATETKSNWAEEIRDDIIEESKKHGGLLHIYVDTASPQGNVYIKCPTIQIAQQCVAALHGRYFAGRVITAAYVPVSNYHQLFPDSVNSNILGLIGY